MALRFPYRQMVFQNPGITVGGARFRYRPIVDLSVTVGQVTVAREALLDPGADERIAPEAVGILLAST